MPRLWVKKCLQCREWKEVPDVLVEHLRFGWSGLLNSKLIEDCNKIQRDAERNIPNKELGCISGWAALTQKQLLAKYHRCEVSVDALRHVPAGQNWDSLFGRNREVTDEDRRFLEGVKQTSSWPTHTPESEQASFVHMALLARCAKAGQWELAETAWFSGLLPEGTAMVLPNHSPALVVRTYAHGALVWPLRAKGSYLVVDEAVASLFWVHLHDLQCGILELIAHSPARRASCGDRSNQGIGLFPGPETPLLQFQQQRAFAGVKELAATCV